MRQVGIVFIPTPGRTSRLVLRQMLEHMVKCIDPPGLCLPWLLGKLGRTEDEPVVCILIQIFRCIRYRLRRLLRVVELSYLILDISACHR